MTRRQGWTPDTLAALSKPAASRLREELSQQTMTSDPSARREAFRVLGQLNARQDLKPPEQRAKDAKTFLHPGPASEETRQRAWEVACELHGGAKQAERKGYRPPGEAA